MWLSIISFLGGPVVKGLIESYRLHLQANTNDKKIASDLAGQEIAAQTAETQAIYNLRIAQIGHPYEPEKLAFYVVLVYMAKVMLWDAAFGFGTTDPVKGAVGVWAGLVMTFYFGKRMAENVTRIITAVRG